MENSRMNFHSMSTISGSSSMANGNANGAPSASQMETQVKHLGLLVFVLNENLEKFGRRDKFTLKEFDRPISPELFRKILIFLIGLIEPDTLDSLENQSGRQVGLQKLNDTNAFKAKIGYDPTIDNVYWACRRIFQMHKESIDYNILYFPHKEPKRVKHVLGLATQFAVFCEQAAERFDEVEEQLNEEMEQKEEMKNAIEEVKAKCNDRMAKLEEWKSELPYFREQVKLNNDRIRDAEAELGELETEIRKYKDVFDTAEQKNINIEKQLELIKSQILKKKPLVVTDGEQLLTARENELQLLAACSKEREELGVRLQKLTQSDAELGAVIDNATAYATELEEFVTFLQSVVELAEKQNAVTNDLKTHERRMKDNDAEIHRLKSQVEELKRRNQEDKMAKLDTIKQLTTELEIQQLELQNRKGVQQVGRDKVDKMRQEIENVKQLLKKKEEEIAKNLDFVENKGPQEIEKIKKELRDAVEIVNRSTGPAALVKMLDARNLRRGQE